MNEKEEKVMEHLIAAWNEFISLPVQHPDDHDEFRHDLHRLQHLIGMRELRRIYPNRWYNANEEDGPNTWGDEKDINKKADKDGNEPDKTVPLIKPIHLSEGG